MAIAHRRNLRLVVPLAAAVGLLAYQIIRAPRPVAGAVRSSTGEAQTHSSDGRDGAQAYAANCALCHGPQREGILPGFPPLLGVARTMTDAQVIAIIHTGKGRMPAFPNLQGDRLTALVHYLDTKDIAAPKRPISAAGDVAASHSQTLAEAGGQLFQQSCAFCHGRDATGGETGPDLTRSKLVRSDIGGDKISEVVRNGRTDGDKRMPAFNFSDREMRSLAAFVHVEEVSAAARGGNRKGVDAADLQIGDVAAGKRYFNGAGTCSSCHSPTGDLAGVASRYEGLELEERMLYPRGVKGQVTVTLGSGEHVTGRLAYKDEFVIGLLDSNGTYRSWRVGDVKYKIHSPVEAHAEMLGKYTDADVHNLMAYIQMLR